ncbi:hypothetical protein Q5752_004752 [Cryptotrichosporon argae]
MLFIAKLALALAAAGLVSAQNFTVNTPASLIECQPAALSWVGGTSPYIVAVIPGGEVSAAAYETINDDVADTSTTWTVNLAADTSVTIKVTDATGAIAYSSADTIQAGADTSCVNATTSASASASASASSGAATSSAAAAASGASTSTVSAASGSTSATAASSSAASAVSSASGAASSASAAASSTSKAASSASSAAAAASSSSSSSSGALRNAGVPVALLLAGAGAVAALL